MRNKILFLFCLALLSSCASKMKTVKIIYTEMYCGGAAPPEELVKDLETPKPYAAKDVEVFVKGDLSHKPQVFKSNEKGEIRIPRKISDRISLSLYPTEDLFKTGEDPDPNYTHCYRDFITRNLLEVDLKNKKALAEFTVFIICNPCVPPHP